MNANLARVLQSLFSFSPSENTLANSPFPRSNFVNRYLRLFRILLILEPFIRDGDILSFGTKLLYDLSDFRVIMVVL